MTSKTASKLILVLTVSGFILWAYGFFYSSFWYAEAKPSLLDPVREWIYQVAGVSMRPGLTEEIFGLGTAFAGILIHVGRLWIASRVFSKS